MSGVIVLAATTETGLYFRVAGRATFACCADVRNYAEDLLTGDFTTVDIDIADCTGMDSTFLGILTGTALDLREQKPAGILILCNLSKRNYQLVHNLGLHTLLTIAEDLANLAEIPDQKSFFELKNVEVSDAREVLKAHENLVKADVIC